MPGIQKFSGSPAETAQNPGFIIGPEAYPDAEGDFGKSNEGTVTTEGTIFKATEPRSWGEKDSNIYSYRVSGIRNSPFEAESTEEFIFFKSDYEYIEFKSPSSEFPISPVLLMRFPNGENGFLFLIPKDRKPELDVIELYWTFPCEKVARVDLLKKRGNPLLPLISFLKEALQPFEYFRVGA